MLKLIAIFVLFMHFWVKGTTCLCLMFSYFVNLYKSVSVVEGFVFMVRLQGGYMTIMELVGSFNEQNC